jgi:hypothetical protein
VIVSFMILFMVNAIASAIYFQVLPPRGL